MGMLIQKSHFEWTCRLMVVRLWSNVGTLHMYDNWQYQKAALVEYCKPVTKLSKRRMMTCICC